MTKAEFAKAYAAYAVCTKAAAKQAYEFFVQGIADELANTGSSHVAGLGTFKVKTTAERPMPNRPGTFTVPRQVVKFKASSLINESVA
jgi:nucleoid DNA-binding protein